MLLKKLFSFVQFIIVGLLSSCKTDFKQLKIRIMKEYALIFRHQDGSKIASPEQMQAWMKQTMDWVGHIAAKNKFVAGIGLPFDNARVVRANHIVEKSPFGALNETIGGYIIVKADSVDEAVEFAKGSPVLQGAENSVEVREIARH